MKRKVTREMIDYGKFLVKIKLEEDEVTALSALSANPRQSLIDLLGAIINNPANVEYNGFKPFKIELLNNDGKWILISSITETIEKT